MTINLNIKWSGPWDEYMFRERFEDVSTNNLNDLLKLIRDWYENTAGFVLTGRFGNNSSQWRVVFDVEGTDTLDNLIDAYIEALQAQLVLP